MKSMMNMNPDQMPTEENEEEVKPEQVVNCDPPSVIFRFEISVDEMKFSVKFINGRFYKCTFGEAGLYNIRMWARLGVVSDFLALLENHLDYFETFCTFQEALQHILKKAYCNSYFYTQEGM